MFQPNKIVKSLAFIFGVIALSLSLSYVVLAWTEPSSVPPGCTSGTPGCNAPLNVSSTGQAKSGFLRLGGTTVPTETLIVGEAGAALGLLRTTGAAVINEGNGAGFSTYGLLVPNGNVGIGMTAPSAKLDIGGETAIPAPAVCTVTGAADILTIGGAGCIDNFTSLGIDVGSQIITATSPFMDARMVIKKIDDTHVKLQNAANWNGNFSYIKNAQALKISDALVTTGQVSFNGNYEGEGGISIPKMDIIVGGGGDGVFALRHNGFGAGQIVFGYENNPTTNRVMIIDTKKDWVSINSVLKLVPISSAPSGDNACNAGNKGAMYYDDTDGLCICNGGVKYVKVVDNVTQCN